ncbi:hypothetical protein [Pseudomonas sp. NPDC089569]|uniref:hypothetical protein n=1 Tax=Pseudomonas sp. NPDC089569 TaxID=3390722 RepID=UPI003D059946
MTTKAIEVPQGRIVDPRAMSKSLIKTIKAAVKSSAVTTTCEWLVSEGYASDLVHASELVETAINNPGSTLKYWLGTCSACGIVKVKQKSKPTSCKSEIRTGPRSIRRCGNPLTDQQDVTAKVEAAALAQANTTVKEGLDNGI